MSNKPRRLASPSRVATQLTFFDELPQKKLDAILMGWFVAFGTDTNHIVDSGVVYGSNREEEDFPTLPTRRPMHHSRESDDTRPLG